MTALMDNDADALNVLMADAKLHAAKWMQRSNQRLPFTYLLHGTEGKMLFAPAERTNLKDGQSFWELAVTAQNAFEANAMVAAVEGWIWVNPKGVEQDEFALPDKGTYRQKLLLLVGQTSGTRVEEHYRIDRGERGEFLGFGEVDGKLLLRTRREFNSWFGEKPSEEEIQQLLVNPAISKEQQKEFEMPEEEWRRQMKQSLRHEAQCAIIPYEEIDKHQKQAICLGL